MTEPLPLPTGKEAAGHTYCSSKSYSINLNTMIKILFHVNKATNFQKKKKGDFRVFVSNLVLRAY